MSREMEARAAPITESKGRQQTSTIGMRRAAKALSVDTAARQIDGTAKRDGRENNPAAPPNSCAPRNERDQRAGQIGGRESVKIAADSGIYGETGIIYGRAKDG